MSLIIPANSAAAGGYAVDNSCRFNDDDSPNMQKTISTTGNRISSWVHPKNFILINSCDNICLHE